MVLHGDLANRQGEEVPPIWSVRQSFKCVRVHAKPFEPANISTIPSYMA